MEFLEKLTQSFSPSGREEEICDIIFEEIKDYADSVYKDTLGNLIVRKEGNGKKIMFSAHTDEIGIMITYIDDKGFLRFSPIGWVDPFYALYQRVKFQSGITGVISYEEKTDAIKDIKMKNLFIDIGAKDKEEAQKMVSIGDTAQFVGDFVINGDRVMSKTLDNRAGVYVLTEAIKKIKSNNDLYFVFTSQEEVGLRGAKTSTFDIFPDFAIAVDVTDTGDTPECNYMAVSLGDGPCIKIKDQSVICDRELVQRIKSVATNNSIPYQLEVLEHGGTDAGAMHITRSGVKTGAISIPTRYIHSTCETCDINDIKNAILLVEKIADEI
ncbi:MAG: M42 family metallopeptidase [Ruminococcaceae bacterium]|nr:M42 family metallopeptidase [Oscillospiraceae bacterium]